MKLYFEKRILVGFFISLSIFIVLGGYTYINNQRSLETSHKVSHTNKVLYHIEQIKSSTLQIEAELLRYKILGDTSFFTFYRNIISTTRDHLQKLKVLVVDNPAQLQRIDTFLMEGRKKYALIQKVLEERPIAPNAPFTTIPSPENRRVMKKIEAVINAMEEEENRLMKERVEANEQEVAKFNITFILLQLFSGFVLAGVMITIHRNLKKRVLAEKSLTHALTQIRDLYDNAPCGYHSLDHDGRFLEVNDTMLRWLGYEREDLVGKLTFLDIVTENGRAKFLQEYPLFKERGFINNIEFDVIRKDGSTFPIIITSTADKDSEGRFLRSRSSTFNNTEQKKAEFKILQLNHELEAFTYSVSHDLRAPLRSIDGYARIVHEDYGAKLDAEGNRLFAVILKNSRRMGQLIDDLLDFSRLGRKELHKQEIDMNALVDSVRKELMDQQKECNAKIIQHALPPAIGDPSMLRQVWINLISNALKYSQHHASPQIEIGSTVQDGKTVYSIRDNGVGFDMKYVHKLFGVFQRLHKIEEFEGTGVGLALIHRIITRHGGTVWAEAKVNNGAVFSFSIPTFNPHVTHGE